ncbi:MAG: Arc family DNA binding domain-containing protein [Bacteroidetes bacterium]|nr:Arc family DNA binding domain-containing protein [Bacteroidota bacterium]
MPKKSFALRIDEVILNAVEKWAADEFRSTNGQLEWIISRALKESGRQRKRSKRNDIDETSVK